MQTRIDDDPALTDAARDTLAALVSSGWHAQWSPFCEAWSLHQDTRLGDTELVTFRAQCGVPAEARRIPDEGQKERDGWFQVGWVWEDAT